MPVLAASSPEQKAEARSPGCVPGWGPATTQVALNQEKNRGPTGRYGVMVEWASATPPKIERGVRRGRAGRRPFRVKRRPVRQYPHGLGVPTAKMAPIFCRILFLQPCARIFGLRAVTHEGQKFGFEVFDIGSEDCDRGFV